MSLIEQIKRDIQAIEEIISIVPLATVGSENLQETASSQFSIEQYLDELARLKAIIASGIVPESYTSIITKEIYQDFFDESNQSTSLSADSFLFFCRKTSRKREHQLNSKFELFNSNKEEISFFSEHNDGGFYPSGGVAGKVKKCFVLGDTTPKYALKIFRNNSFNFDALQNTLDELRIAMRNVYCNRLLGRASYAFRQHGKQYMLCEWLPGTTLDKVPREVILAIPIHKRITMVLPLIRDLAILHRHGISHNDLKPSNIMLGDNLSLFDFDSVRLDNESEVIPLNSTLIYTQQFLDAQMNYDIKMDPTSIRKKLNCKSDFYALGSTLAFFFPDVISPFFGKKTVTVDNGPNKFTFNSIILMYGEKFKAYEVLGNLIIKLTSTRNCPESIESVFEELSVISRRYSRQVIPPLDTVVPVITGETVFKQIENEIVSFKTDSIKDNLAESSFKHYLPYGAAAAILIGIGFFAAWSYKNSDEINISNLSPRS